MIDRYLRIVVLLLIPHLLGAARLTDARGIELVLPKPAARIVSSSLASDELAIALLQESGSLQRLVAVSALADDPRYSNIVPVPASIRGRFAGDVEATLAMVPDLVIVASFNRPEALRRFEQAKVPIFVLPDFVGFDGLLKHIDRLGELLHVRQQATRLQEQVRTELEQLQVRAAPLQDNKPRILHVYSDGTVSGSDTMLDAIVRAAGASNAAAGVSGWKKLSIEALLRLDPDCMIVTDDEQITIAQIPGLRQLRAVTTGCMIRVPGNQLSALSHHVLKAVRKIQDGLLDFKDAEARTKTKQQVKEASPGAGKQGESGRPASAQSNTQNKVDH